MMPAHWIGFIELDIGNEPGWKIGPAAAGGPSAESCLPRCGPQRGRVNREGDPGDEAAVQPLWEGTLDIAVS